MMTALQADRVNAAIKELWAVAEECGLSVLSNDDEADDGTPQIVITLEGWWPENAEGVGGLDLVRWTLDQMDQEGLPTEQRAARGTELVMKVKAVVDDFNAGSLPGIDRATLRAEVQELRERIFTECLALSPENAARIAAEDGL